ncbi:MAG: alanyl-tRNA synthetase [Candidatus Berkelbacteria bacterium Licking1014_7]|uniref:alanine--tRNA ligase n=1 Tax=Candidatus Berkelbacteria bacterium Licking1014_7 TaxID=2017147 RepID=A0A554LIZ3_9BACT|nr:MAG: alanyl-tRNA synthetase [Candidatus Berkelbacteria bacterium Licking1014_7]
MITSKKLRQKFVDYFASKGYKKIPETSLVPKDDPSVLFTTAGMQQFKKFYLAPDEAPAKKVITIQPCVRTSDIDEVGDDTHLTFFEMLGNFTFGDLDKKQAISQALKFLTQELGITKQRIKASYFAGEKSIAEDTEAKNILIELGFLEKNLIRGGKKDNFWGPVAGKGACGPTIEIYIDDIEIWNLVFNEYYFDGQIYQKAQYPGLDTGMGLERMLAVLEGKRNIFEIDVLAPIVETIEKNSRTAEPKNLRVAADHLRASAFLIKDGVLPSNKEQGYILRRFIRRAAVHLKKMNFDFSQLTKVIKKILNIYYEMEGEEGFNFQNEKLIQETIQKEMAVFNQTLKRGLQKLEKLLDKSSSKISGKDAFFLFETFGFPLELTEELARENQKTIDKIGFDKYLKEHQEKSRLSAKKKFTGGLASCGAIETRYHTANHLLLAALRQVLDKHVAQKGSNITNERLRFDFSHPEKMTADEIKKTEALVNEKIQAGLGVETEKMSLADAQASGATGVFSDRYGDRVKVYTIGEPDEKPFSKEICGGPHVKNTREIGKFKIVKEESSSAGVRRIRAKIT